MLLTLLLVAAMALIIGVSISVRGETPRPDSPPATQEGPAAWLSARATFWGAVAGGIGAIGTAGALLLGAITYLRQVRDQHRAQASTVAVLLSRNSGPFRDHVIVVALAGPLPIYNVEITGIDSQQRPLERQVRHVVVRQFGKVYLPGNLSIHEAHVTFTDTSGTRWTRRSTGHLTDHGPEPENFRLEETPANPHEERHSRLQEESDRQAQQQLREARQQAQQRHQTKVREMLGDNYIMDP